MHWEYKIVTVDASGFLGFGAGVVDSKQIEDQLNELGAEGWELATAFETNANGGGTRSVSLLFKRGSVIA